MVDLRVFWKAEADSAEMKMIELQGSIEHREDSINHLSKQVLGELGWDKVRNCPILLIGHHKLVGEVVTLKKPFAIMKRRAIPISTSTNHDVEEDHHREDHYELIGLIRQKWLFRSRPEHLVDKFDRFMGPT